MTDFAKQVKPVKKRKPVPVHCYEANKDGSLTLYLDEDVVGSPNDFTIEKHDVTRLMYACIDALKRKPARR